MEASERQPAPTSDFEQATQRASLVVLLYDEMMWVDPTATRRTLRRALAHNPALIIPFALELVNSHEPDNRLDAADMLAEIREQDPSDAAGIVATLKRDTDERIRSRVASSLKTLKSRSTAASAPDTKL